MWARRGGYRLAVVAALELYLDPVADRRLRKLWDALLGHHAAVYARLAAAGASAFDEYRPGAWVPHCTLSMRVPHARIPDALRLCLDTLPITATVAGAALADHSRDLYIPLAPPAAGSG